MTNPSTTRDDWTVSVREGAAWWFAFTCSVLGAVCLSIAWVASRAAEWCRNGAEWARPDLTMDDYDE